MLIFNVENNRYCCNCDLIIEIIPKIPLILVPHTPDYIVGVLNYGGDSVPVMDFSTILVGHPSKNSMHTRMILLRYPIKNDRIKIVGLIAENIVEVRDIDPKLFNAGGLHIPNFTFLNGMYNSQNESIQWVNLDQLFLSLPLIHNDVKT